MEHITNLSNMKVICFLAKVERIEMQGRHASSLGRPDVVLHAVTYVDHVGRIQIKRRKRKIEDSWVWFRNANDVRIDNCLDRHALSRSYLADPVSDKLLFDVTVRVAHNSQSEIRVVETPQSSDRPAEDTPPQVG